MKRLTLSILLAAVLTLPLPFYKMNAQVDVAPAVRFETLDIIIDPHGQPLAAYQFELTAPGSAPGRAPGSAPGRTMTIVGLENGDHPAYPNPPRYDPRALHNANAARVIVADYSLLPADQLPTGPTRVATVHVQITAAAGEKPYDLKLITAGNTAGKKIHATIQAR